MTNGTKRVKGQNTAFVLDSMRRKLAAGWSCMMQADIPKDERRDWNEAVEIGFLRREKVQGFVCFFPTDEMHVG
jgi:hypothetical protein